MQIKLDKLSDNQGTLYLELSGEDYLPEYRQELKKYKNKAQIKGFRPGKAPEALIKKMYGQGLIYDVVTKKMSKLLNEYIESENLELFGEILPSPLQKKYDFSSDSEETYEFVFDIAWRDKGSIKGIGPDARYSIYKIELTDDEIDREIEKIRGSYAIVEDSDQPISLDDILEIRAVELTSENPHECKFKISVKDIVDEQIRQELIGKLNGHTFDFNIYQLENLDRNQVRKYLLGIKDEHTPDPGEMFSGEILSVKRRQIPDWDEQLMEKVFGEALQDQDEARRRIADYVASIQEPTANGMLFKDLKKTILQQNDVAISDDFIKRQYNQLRRDAQDSDDSGDPSLIKDALLWIMIRDQLAEEMGIEVTQQDLEIHFARMIQQYYGGAQVAQQVLQDLVSKMLKNQKMVNEAYHQIKDNKVFFAIKDRIQLEENKVNLSTFEQIVQEMSAESAEVV